jgi:membrane peptidoglycan carboxypeptidase
MKEATIAVEDKDFYHEGAFNVKGITRAAINNATGGSTQGGSTITQQLVKLTENWTSDHTVSRKVKELILAVELEREYSKDDILNAYLNLAPYSGTDDGVEAAAQDLFHTDASKLNLAQSALLASIPKNPNYLSPYASLKYNPGATYNLFDEQGLIGRQHYTLDLMAKQGYVTQAEADAAKQVAILGPDGVQHAPDNHYAGMKPGFAYAVDTAKQELANKFPPSFIKTGGWKVTTTIDANLQDLANKAVNDNVHKLHTYGADNAAFVAEDNATGQVLALIGGTDFDNHGLNFASHARISPGSSVKPYSYATLINNNNNVGAGSMIYDAQGAVSGWSCTNKATPEKGGNCLWDDTRKYYGPVTLRYALGSSLNVPAVKAFTSTSHQPDNTTAASGDDWHLGSIRTSMSTINALMGGTNDYGCLPQGTTLSGGTDPDPNVCRAAAGIGNEAYTTLADHVNGIASLARLGQSIPQSFILQVTNASGKVLPDGTFTQPKPKQVLNAEAAYIVNDMAADGGASYLGGSCNATNCSGSKFHRYKGWENAIKTGTNGDLDGLMMSWNTKFTAGVWVGNYNRSPWKTDLGPENVTDPIMKTFMQGAIDSLGNVPATNWPKPAGIKTLAAFHSAVPFHSQSQPPATDLFPSWYVGKTNGGSSQTTDKVSGKLATSCTPPLARQTDGNTSTTQWNVDIYMGGTPNSSTSGSSNNNSSQPTDDVHDCANSTPPSVTITTVNGVPTGGSSTLNCPASGCLIKVHIEQGDHALTDPAYPNFPGTLSLIVNGDTVQSQQIDNANDYTLTYIPASGTTGSTQLEAQISDSLLYSGTDTRTINVTNGPSAYRSPTIGRGKDPIALASAKHGKK